MASLKDLVLRVERYLKYLDYHAENSYPFPEDLSVAEWVREEAEPNGWTRFSQDPNAPLNKPEDKETPATDSSTKPAKPQETSQTTKKILTI